MEMSAYVTVELAYYKNNYINNSDYYYGYFSFCSYYYPNNAFMCSLFKSFFPSSFKLFQKIESSLKC